MKQTETRSALTARLRRIAVETDELEAALQKRENEREQIAKALALLDELDKELGRLPAPPPRGSRRANGVKARVLQIVTTAKEPVNSTEIVRELGVASADVYKALSALQAENKVRRISRGIYAKPLATPKVAA